MWIVKERFHEDLAERPAPTDAYGAFFALTCVAVAIRFVHPPHDKVSATMCGWCNDSANLAHVQRVCEELDVLASHAALNVILNEVSVGGV